MMGGCAVRVGSDEESEPAQVGVPTSVFHDRGERTFAPVADPFLWTRKSKQMDFWDFFRYLDMSYVLVAYPVVLFHIVATSRKGEHGPSRVGPDRLTWLSSCREIA
jgi:hypothetical protein